MKNLFELPAIAGRVHQREASNICSVCDFTLEKVLCQIDGCRLRASLNSDSQNFSTTLISLHVEIHHHHHHHHRLSSVYHAAHRLDVSPPQSSSSNSFPGGKTRVKSSRYFWLSEIECKSNRKSVELQKL